jgi:nitroreductase
MVAFLKIAQNRRSVRDFKAKKPSDNDIFYLLETARWAPSANNLQPWRFIVIRDKDNKKKIAKAAYDQSWIEKAPVLILVCSLSGLVERQFPKTGNSLAKQSVAAAIENIHLAAGDKGMATCWVAIPTIGRLKSGFDLPDGVEVHGAVAVGYPRRIGRTPSKIPLADLVFFEEWDNLDLDYTKSSVGEMSKPLLEKKPIKKIRSKLKGK